MTREALIYGEIGSWSAREFIESVNEILEKDANSELTVRVNSNGGDVDYAWGAINKFSEFPNKKFVMVDGKAQSMGLYFLAYANEVKAPDFANFLLHRASYPTWVETNPVYFTQQRQDLLTDANKKLRAALEAKIDVAIFEKITGHTLDEVFSMEGCLEVVFTAAQAKRMGLVDQIVTVTPKKQAEIEAKMFEITAKHNGISVAAKTEPEPKPKKTSNMILSELKAEHPALYAEVISIGEKEGAKKEKERIEAWAHFAEVDPKAVKAGIASGEAITQAQSFELMEKKFSKKAQTDLEDDSNKDPLKTKETDPTKTAKEKELEDFKAGVLANSSVLGAPKK